MSEEMPDIKYSVSSKKNKYMCDYEESGDYVRAIEVLAHDGDKIVGRLNGYIFNMMGLMEEDILDIFDESCVLDRLYCTMYHGTPLSLTGEDVIKGFRPEFLSFINGQFGQLYDDHNHPEFEEDLWATHYMANIGFVEDVIVNQDMRGKGIGKGLMTMLKKFTKDIDYLILQSYPNTIGEHIRELGLTHEEKDQYCKTKAYKEMFKKEQSRVDGFYQGLSFLPYKALGFQWMLMDKEGLRKLPSMPTSSIIKRPSKKKPYESSLEF
jgi:GNAT superfamily N-acetyltransferase